MSLIEIWKSNPAQLENYRVRQIVNFAGNGILSDGAESSDQFREYLRKIDSGMLGTYVEQCLSESFEQGGFVLQDLVNELGRRLDYDVQNGRYKGVRGEVGFDGIWRSPEAATIIVEVKTSDTYRINLDTLANYRLSLRAERTIVDPSSMLLVVGRQDTGDLEAQIRGSRHAWDIRLLSAESLVKLIALKESSDDDSTAERIRGLLTPHEYTRLDPLIDMVFATAEDIKTPVEGPPDEETSTQVPEAGETTLIESTAQRSYEQTDPALMGEIRHDIVRAFSKAQNKELLKKSKAQFWSSDKKLRVCCTISKYYERTSGYWYAYHPQWDEFLSAGDPGFLLLGCVGSDIAFALPRSFIFDLLPDLNVTERSEGKKYWHLHLDVIQGEKHVLRLKGVGNTVAIDQYKIHLS